MKCPNYKNKDVKLKFNKLVILFGGTPLSDEEFKNKESRRQRVGDNYTAADLAYKMWNELEEDSIDRLIDTYVNPMSKQNINHVLDVYDKYQSPRTTENHIIHMFKDGNYYVNKDKDAERKYLYRYPNTDERKLLPADEYITRTFDEFLQTYHLPSYGIFIDANRKITIFANSYKLNPRLEFLKEYEESLNDDVNTEDEAKTAIEELERQLKDSSEKDKLTILGKIQRIKCKYGII